VLVKGIKSRKEEGTDKKGDWQGSNRADIVDEPREVRFNVVLGGREVA